MARSGKNHQIAAHFKQPKVANIVFTNHLIFITKPITQVSHMRRLEGEVNETLLRGSKKEASQCAQWSTRLVFDPETRVGLEFSGQPPSAPVWSSVLPGWSISLPAAARQFLLLRVHLGGCNVKIGGFLPCQLSPLCLPQVFLWTFPSKVYLSVTQLIYMGTLKALRQTLTNN